MKAGCRARGRGLVQFPRSFVLKCAWRGSAHDPTIVPEASIPKSSPPLARTTAVIFQLVLLQGVWVGGEGYLLREPLEAGMGVGAGESLAWVLKLSAWPPQMVL